MSTPEAPPVPPPDADPDLDPLDPMNYAEGMPFETPGQTPEEADVINASYYAGNEEGALPHATSREAAAATAEVVNTSPAHREAATNLNREPGQENELLRNALDETVPSRNPNRNPVNLPENLPRDATMNELLERGTKASHPQSGSPRMSRYAAAKAAEHLRNNPEALRELDRVREAGRATAVSLAEQVAAKQAALEKAKIAEKAAKDKLFADPTAPKPDTSNPFPANAGFRNKLKHRAERAAQAVRNSPNTIADNVPRVTRVSEGLKSNNGQPVERLAWRRRGPEKKRQLQALVAADAERSHNAVTTKLAREKLERELDDVSLMANESAGRHVGFETMLTQIPGFRPEDNPTTVEATIGTQEQNQQKIDAALREWRTGNNAATEHAMAANLHTLSKKIDNLDSLLGTITPSHQNYHRLSTMRNELMTTYVAGRYRKEALRIERAGFSPDHSRDFGGRRDATYHRDGGIEVHDGSRSVLYPDGSTATVATDGSLSERRMPNGSAPAEAVITPETPMPSVAEGLTAAQLRTQYEQRLADWFDHQDDPTRVLAARTYAQANAEALRQAAEADPDNIDGTLMAAANTATYWESYLTVAAGNMGLETTASMDPSGAVNDQTEHYGISGLWQIYPDGSMQLNQADGTTRRFSPDGTEV